MPAPTIIVAPDRVRKGERKMRALAAGIHRVLGEARRVRGGLAPGPSLELEHLDDLANALEESLVAIRTLDLEVYEKSDRATYQSLRENQSGGPVVRALTQPRNNAVHHVEVIDPDVARAVGPLSDGTYLVFPRWKRSVDLPSQVFVHAHGQKKGQIDVEASARYDAHIAGRTLLDTLLDAFDFFDRCDPRLADRNAEGELTAFPALRI